MALTFAIGSCLASFAAGDEGEAKDIAIYGSEPDYAKLTRQADAVAVVQVVQVGDSLLVDVQKVLKGELPQGRLAALGPTGGKAKVGEQLLVFVKKATATSAGAAICQWPRVGEVRAVLQLDAMRSDEEKLRYLLGVSDIRGFGDFVVGELEAMGRRGRISVLLLRECALDPNRCERVLPAIGTDPRAEVRRLPGEMLESPSAYVVYWGLAYLHVVPSPDDAVSNRILALQSHEESVVRNAAVAVMHSWPWWQQSPRVRQGALPRLRHMAFRDHNVAAGEALVDMRDVASFYRLWALSVRERARLPLDLLWESRPVTVSLMLLWPTLLMLAAVVVARLRWRLRWLMRTTAIGLVAGYAVGAAGGWVIGTYWTCNPVFSACILYPPLALPLGVGVASLLYTIVRRGRQKVEDGPAV